MQDKQKPKKPVLPEWQCELDELEKPLAELTVADKFALVCTGDFVEEVMAPAEFVFLNKDDEFRIHVLDTKAVEPQRVDLIATSYKPGKHTLTQVQLQFVSDKKVTLKPFELQVNSVIDKKSKQPPEMFGPKGPYEVPLPWWYYTAFGFAFLAVFFIIASAVNKILVRKKLVEEMQQFQTAMSPYNQFNKDLRTISRPFSNLKDENITEQKVTDFMDALKDQVAMYLVRELSVPAHKWTVKQVIADLKKRHKKLYRDNGVMIYKLLLEFDRFNKGSEFKRFDCDQLALMARNTVTQVNKFQIQEGQR